MADIREVAESLLAQSAAINVGVEAQTVLFTVPAGKVCRITKIIMHSASAAIGTAKLGFGWNDGVATDVIADTDTITLSQDDNYKILSPDSNAKNGAAADTLEVDVATAEGNGDTAKFDVFGYLIDA